jgi:DNA invertase Pin-like site-specific DNA recombinase
MSKVRPLIYLRVAHGGRAAAEEQERDVRAMLRASGIDSCAMHVSCDLNSPGDIVGVALGSLLEEARGGHLETVIVRDVARLGYEHSVVVGVLSALTDAGVGVVVAEALEHEGRGRARLRESGLGVGPPCRLTLAWGPVPTQEVR